jgi:tRNA nucleotidyltransferase (CCA-adding enzyme)
MDEYGFSIHHETLALLDEIVEQGEVDHLVAERVWQEFERALLSVRPRRFIEVLRQCGALKKILPELDALFGVPQRARYHPEIDTGEHTLMVLDRACDLSDSLCVRYAALMHDLGKALTPESVLPAHHGHEEAGVKPLRQISQRLRVPTACQDLAELACRYHTHIHRGLELRSKTIVELFHKLDAFRRPDRFEALLLVCLADKQGRGGGMTVHYTQQDFLRECLDAARVVSVEDLAAQSLPGNLIGKHLRKRRLDAVQKVWALWRS